MVTLADAAAVLLVLLTVGLVAWACTPAWRGRGSPVVVRCLGGHVFTTVWAPASSLRTARAGPVRLRFCPVTGHWTLVSPVRPGDLTPAELRMARHCHDQLGR